MQVVELLSSNLEVEKTYLGEPVQGEEFLFKSNKNRNGGKWVLHVLWGVWGE